MHSLTDTPQSPEDRGHLGKTCPFQPVNPISGKTHGAQDGTPDNICPPVVVNKGQHSLPSYEELKEFCSYTEIPGKETTFPYSSCILLSSFKFPSLYSERNASEKNVANQTLPTRSRFYHQTIFFGQKR